MESPIRIRDYGVVIGELNTGKLNSIADVAGVTVGHTTLSNKGMQTGVTAILPHQGNIFKDKLIASSYIINGFGKTMGTIQLNELGTIETPIILTNTLSVGTAADALIEYMLKQNPEIGRTTGTVNPVIGECNDMKINNIRERFINKRHIFQAIDSASADFKEGSVGAGTGMVCYSLKGGIGSSSRKIELSHETYTIGVLVLSNFGTLSDLTINGKAIGKEILKLKSLPSKKDDGSIMIIVATDLPVSERQLNRILKRTVTGLSRTGSIISSGSGDVVIGFSTAVKIPHKKPDHCITVQTIHEDDIDPAFRAVGEATEEAILNSFIAASPITGIDGNKYPTFEDLVKELNITLSTE